MKKQIFPTVILIIALALTLVPPESQAQRLYNKERDEQAQAALPLAQALKTGELFDRQLKNAASLAKQDFETEFLITKSQINSTTLSLLTWTSVHEFVCDVETRNTQGIIPSAQVVDDALKDLKTSIAEAQKSLEAFKKSVGANENDEQDEENDGSILTTLFSNIGQLSELRSFAEQIGVADAKTLDSLKEVQDIANELKKVYDTYKAKVDEFNKLNAQLADLRVVLKKVAIQSLQVDEAHWKNIAAITARRERERVEVLSLIKQYKGVVKRLQLVNFTEQDKFCTAVVDAKDEKKGLDIRPHQVITDYIKELVERSESLDKDNREIEAQARIAIRTMSNASSEPERRAAARQTLAALTNAINNIDQRDSIHTIETGNRRAMFAARDTLESAVRDSKPEGLRALNSIIILTRTNSLTIRNIISDVPQVLFIVAALIARGSTATRLADLRFAQELHLYSIRKSAVRARAYELTVSTGAQRLALFHKGGIKPTDVAELVFAASNIAITPAILAR